MTKSYYWVGVMIGLLLLTSSGCSVKQQQDVLAGVGTLIPGSRNSMLYPESTSSSTQNSSVTNVSQASPGATQTATAPPPPPPPPAPRNDLGATDAQLVLQTMQRAMRDNPTPFIECLDNTACRSAFTTHLIRLQKLAGGTLELPPVYERYDLQRGKE
jgi:hypothetical protein